MLGERKAEEWLVRPNLETLYIQPSRLLVLRHVQLKQLLLFQKRKALVVVEQKLHFLRFFALLLRRVLVKLGFNLLDWTIRSRQ